MASLSHNNTFARSAFPMDPSRYPNWAGLLPNTPWSVSDSELKQVGARVIRYRDQWILSEGERIDCGGQLNGHGEHSIAQAFKHAQNLAARRDVLWDYVELPYEPLGEGPLLKEIAMLAQMLGYHRYRMPLIERFYAAPPDLIRIRLCYQRGAHWQGIDPPEPFCDPDHLSVVDRLICGENWVEVFETSAVLLIKSADPVAGLGDEADALDATWFMSLPITFGDMARGEEILSRQGESRWVMQTQPIVQSIHDKGSSRRIEFSIGGRS